jgi:hypothetical protein
MPEWQPVLSNFAVSDVTRHLRILKSEDMTPRMPPPGVHREITMTTIEIKIRRNDSHATPGKLAEAELHFTGGELDGLKLVGFAVWEARNGEPRYVSLPAHQSAIDGARCSFILLRWTTDPKAQDRLRDVVLQAYTRQTETSGAVELGAHPSKYAG